MGRRLRALTLALAVTSFGCKKAAPGPTDAGEPTGPVRRFGVELSLPPEWTAVDAGATERFEARRTVKGAALAVPARLVVEAEAVAAFLDARALADQTIREITELEAGGQLRVHRTTTGLRILEGVPVGEIEVSYAVQNPTGGRAEDVVQRGLVLRRDLGPETPRAVHLSATYLATQEESVGPEVDRIFASLRLAEPEAKPD